MIRALTPMWAIGLLLMVTGAAFAQYAPSNYRVAGASVLDDVTTEPRLTSNVIIDIMPSPQSGVRWLGTGDGVTRVTVNFAAGAAGVSFQSIAPEQMRNALLGGNAKGGTSGFVVTDSILWAAFAFDTSVGVSGAGGGLAYSRDNGANWTWLPQPRDRLYDLNRDTGFDNVLGYWPTTTNVDNISYDIALSDSFVWIASKGGGLRRHAYAADYTDFNDTTGWRVVSPLILESGDTLEFHPGDPGLGLVHRPFSVIFADSTIYAGTAQGILRSTNEGRTWKNITAQNTNYNLSGNFVTAMGYQSATHTVWAATWRAEAQSEFYAVSASSDRGNTWHAYLDSAQVVRALGRFETVRAHGFAFDDSTVYVCDDLGLWKSPDAGRNWDLFAAPAESGAGAHRFYENAIYSAMADPEQEHWLWAGGVDGIALSTSDGVNWNLFQAATPLASGARPVDTYAYPNPWSPARFGPIKLRYQTSGGATKISIYDFALSKVVELPAVSRPQGEQYEVWDGRKDGTVVANGTYFYKIDKPGGVFWGKLIVLD